MEKNRMTRGFAIRGLVTLMLALAAALPASAQIFSTSPASSGTVQPQAVFGTGNQRLQEILQLQHQMQLLKQLIAHEKSVNEMVKVATALDLVNPVIPAPDRNICEQLPANISCAKSHDNLYQGFSVERKQILQPITVAPPAPSLVAQSSVPSLEAAALPDLPADQSGFDSGKPFYWTDITCLGRICSAVITPDPANRHARYRVIAGEVLPDGSMVKAISAAGVTLERNKKDIHLDPAPNA